MNEIVTANLLDMEREIGRRSFIRRLFAIGAGIAASGAIVRAVVDGTWRLTPNPAPDAFEGLLSWPTGQAPSSIIVTKAEWDEILREVYKPVIVDAQGFLDWTPSPLKAQRSPRSLFSPVPKPYTYRVRV